MQSRAWRVLVSAATALVLTACASVPGGSSGDTATGASYSFTARARPRPEPSATAAPGTEVGTAPEPRVAWQPCEDDDRFECASLPVPLDHGEPDGGTIDLALIRLPAHEGADTIGSLVVNPGGPGGSGVQWVHLAAVDSIPAELRARFHIVGFDPRGVGESSPVGCGQASPLPSTAGFELGLDGDWSALFTAVGQFTSACEEHSGSLLAHVSTEDAARDLDLIRAAVGDDKLTYLGYSYGTYLGTTYAELFGDRVRALVLDGAVDPALDILGRAEGSAVALEAALDALVEECADEPRCALHDHLADGFTIDGLLTGLSRSPVPAASLGGGRVLHGGDVRLAMLALLRDRRWGWPVLEEGLAMAADGDGSLLLSIADAVLGRGEEVHVDGLASLLAVTCLDLPQPGRDEFLAAAERLEKVAPRVGPAYLMQFAACADWPVPGTRDPAPARVGDATPPLLVVGTTGDAVTPFGWSEAMAAQLGARLLTRNGSQHTAFGGENVCTDRAVIPYLIELVLPPEGWACG